MKLKRVLSLLMALVMTVSLMTLPVHAEDNDFASLTVAEQYAALKSVDNEAEAQALFDTLTEQQQTALVTYAQTQAEQEYTVPQTVVFTEAGPFMPPVNVAPVRMKTMARAAVVPAEDDGNGLVFTKKATDNGNGTYTITMEAYTTGEVITSTMTAPVDIVLVLDQSGSMAFDFDGNEYASYVDSRQYAMKQAVNSFIDNVKAKYDAEKSDHRMAIVTFGSDASTLQGWTSVDEAGKTTLQGKITGLPDSPSGATNVAAGMTRAETLMGSGYSYTGSNTQRQKVVIVFTDGVPTTSTDFDTTVATNAIASAKTLKDAGATVYTVGIFTGANPSELYGASGFDRNSNGTVGSDWSDFSFWMIGDIKSYDIPAGNRFLNYLSSNFTDTTEIGIKKFRRTFLGIGYHGWEITANFDRVKSDYYLTANDSASLNNIFQTISQNIQAANIDLGSKTVIKDIISPYFTAPANASDIHLYTAAAKSDGTFENRVAAPSTVTATVKDGTVSVTGFDYNANFVSSTQKSDGTYGKKLIIEFTVTPRDGFLGGNNVPTNDKAAVYDKGVTEVEDVESPLVNVRIAEPDFTVNDKTIYQGNSVAVSELYTLPAYTGDDEWKDDFVTITADTGLVTGTVSPTDCESYNISVTYAPSEVAKPNSVGTANSMEGVSVTKSATVHVLQPVITATVNDVERYYGESYTLGDGANGTINLTWTDNHNHNAIPAVTGTMPYDVNELSLAYSANAFSGTVPASNFDVTVKVMKGDDEMPATITTTCTHGCGAAQTDGKYTVHVKTCTLTIKKSGCDTDKDANQSFIFDVTGPKTMQVTVQENGTAKIVGLPVGDYTVTEDGNWSWRYTAQNTGDVTLSAVNHDAKVTINNDRTDPDWLSGDSYAVNYVGCSKAQGTFVGA